MRAHLTTAVSRAVRRTRPVRMRLTLIATALVTIALAIAAVVMVFALHHVLVRSADATTAARAQQIADNVRDRGLSTIDRSLLTTGQNIAVIQVVDADGRVVVTNDPRYVEPLLPTLQPGQHRSEHEAEQGDMGDDLRVSALGVSTSDGVLTVEVGARKDPINRTVGLVAVLCCIVFPIVVVGMAWLTYVLVGRALRPVDRIRHRVDEISGGDLTERVPVPATGDEIAALADTMNGMLGRIESARRRQLQFVNNASHELNSPLTTLVGLLDLSRATDQPIDTATASEVMLPDALRLQQMVADMLLLARADESGVPLRLDDVDLDDIVSAEVARLEAVTDLEIDTRIVATRITGDAEKLTRALRNIADNAARYARGRLSITMERIGDAPPRGVGTAVDGSDVDGSPMDATDVDTDPAGTVTVVVADDGPGIPDEDKDRITERFVRLDTARQRSAGDSTGSGLGLAIVGEIIRAHGGELTIGDSESGGAAIGFTLPVHGWPDQPPPSAANL
ncbi:MULTISPECIES: ATP-binding protein [Gordonia]|uniref:HAMP domain-containing sensor histidine kinase n=1 Tax=Gordonia TaxID=2053 RepID=UPI0006B18F49|nr:MULTISPECIES: ATP-binding protein [Gordonia]EMP14825.2 ATP-binding protein [Gordonia sp. NB41Y]WLP90814.1 ATP-binding protein [Gordonia sp. NB41Y]